MRTEVVEVAEDWKDLIGLPVGSQILTATRRLFELDQIEPDAERKDAGKKYWIAPGELQPFPVEGLEHWFPALVLNPVVEYAPGQE